MAAAMLGAVACVAALASCSVLLDWSGFAGGARPDAQRGDATLDERVDAPGSDGGDADDGSAYIDALALVSCGNAMQCAPAAPTKTPNWEGPVALLTGAQGPLPGCDTSAYLGTPVFDGQRGLDAGPARCGCSCSPPQARCDPGQVTFYSDTSCATECGGPTPLNGCVPIPSCTANLSFTAPTPAAGAGCVADGSVALPTPTWAEAARACRAASSATQGSCGTGQLCLPSATAFCVMYTGPGDAAGATCPSGDYSIQHVYYAGLDDERGCTACTCGPPSGLSCSYPQTVPVVGSFGVGCTLPTGMPFFDPLPGVNCTGRVPSALALALLADAGLDAGPCQPSTGTPTADAASPTLPTTFCCTR